MNQEWLWVKKCLLTKLYKKYVKKDQARFSHFHKRK